MNNDFWYRVNDRDSRLISLQLTIPNVTKIRNFTEEKTRELKDNIQKMNDALTELSRVTNDIVYRDAFSTEKYGNIVDKFKKILSDEEYMKIFNRESKNLSLELEYICIVGIKKREKLCDEAKTEMNRQMGLIYNELEDMDEDDDMFGYYEKQYDRKRVERDTVIPTARRGYYDK